MKKMKPIIRLSFLAILIIAAIGFYLRYVSVYETNVVNIIRNDSKEYFSYAYNLRHHKIYSKDSGFLKKSKDPVVPDAVRTPGYPIFLSFFIDAKPTINNISHILFSQLIVSVLTLILMFLLYKKYLSCTFALLAAALTAICPHLIVMNSYLLTETLFCFMLTTMALLISLFVQKPTFLRIFFAGVAMGLANLVRPNLLYFLFPMALFLFFHYRYKKGIAFFAIMLLGFLLTFSPWILRNQKTLGMATDKQLMTNFLHHGMYPDFKFKNNPYSYGYPYRFDPNSKKIGINVVSVLKEINRRFREDTYRHIKWYVFKKPLAFWSWNNVQGKYIFIYPVTHSPYFSRILFKMTYLLMKSSHWVIVLLGMFGALFAWLPKRMLHIDTAALRVARFISLLLVYYTIIHMIGFPLPRYSIPLRPFMYGMAMFGIFFISEFAKNKMRNDQ